jgi:hypothetical protein
MIGRGITAPPGTESLVSSGRIDLVWGHLGAAMEDHWT